MGFPCFEISLNLLNLGKVGATSTFKYFKFSCLLDKSTAISGEIGVSKTSCIKIGILILLAVFKKYFFISFASTPLKDGGAIITASAPSSSAFLEYSMQSFVDSAVVFMQTFILLLAKSTTLLSNSFLSWSVNL